MAVIGVDTGGTKTAGLVLHQGKIEERFRLPTDTSSPDAVVGGVLRVFGYLNERAVSRDIQVTALGVGIAGFIDYDRGVVTEAPNLPLHDLPIRDILLERCGLPACIDNDANVAALAEALTGAGKGARYVVHLTLGTGIGGGIVLDGSLYRGALGSAAELGHMIICEGGPLCNCGARGCLEAVASATAICRRVEEAAGSGESSPVVEDFLADPESFSAEVVGRHADRGEKLALRILSDAGRHLGAGIASLVNIFNPDMVTLSGGLLGSFDHMEKDMRQAVEELSVPVSYRHVHILPGILGEDGGPLGAALLAHYGVSP